jgi:hypothetical protein
VNAVGLQTLLAASGTRRGVCSGARPLPGTQMIRLVRDKRRPTCGWRREAFAAPRYVARLKAVAAAAGRTTPVTRPDDARYTRHFSSSVGAASRSLTHRRHTSARQGATQPASSPSGRKYTALPSDAAGPQDIMGSVSGDAIARQDRRTGAVLAANSRHRSHWQHLQQQPWAVCLCQR